jgi:murein DD-endopeptidase MepM/ murein hydrolase activator NlpD
MLGFPMLKKTASLIVLLFNLTSVQAVPYYLWDNQDGLIEADECQIVPTESTNFKVSSATNTKIAGLENLRTYGGFKQSHVVAGSVIKLVEGRSKRNYRHVEVVGVAKHPTHKANRWFAERLDRGYLYKGSVEEIKDFIIGLENRSPVAKIDGDIALSSTLLKSLNEDNSYHKMECESLTQKRDYTVFSVHQEISEAPIAYIGVYWDETKIFRSIKTSKVSSSDWSGEIISSASADKERRDEVSVNKGIEANVEMETEIEEEVSSMAPTSSLRPVVRPTIAGVSVTEGSNSLMVCMESGTLKVRDEELGKKIFTANAFEKVTLFNSWDSSDIKVKEIAGKDYEFIKVKFTEREAQDQQEGWVAKSFIQTQSDCPFKEPTVNVASANNVKSLDDPNCCIFPVKARATADYTTHRVAKFGANRSGGRKHAATDLYRFKNEPVVAVAPGKVIVGLKPFYFNSYYIVVKHVGGKVVRYGETTGKAVKGASAFNDVLSAGEKLGYVQQIITRKGNVLTPMLHFELYSGELSGALSLNRRTPQNKRGNYNSSYKRRKDLLDPTPYMQKWERAMFGSSY